MQEAYSWSSIVAPLSGEIKDAGGQFPSENSFCVGNRNRKLSSLSRSKSPHFCQEKITWSNKCPLLFEIMWRPGQRQSSRLSPSRSASLISPQGPIMTTWPRSRRSPVGSTTYLRWNRCPTGSTTPSRARTWTRCSGSPHCRRPARRNVKLQRANKGRKKSSLCRASGWTSRQSTFKGSKSRPRKTPNRPSTAHLSQVSLIKKCS